MAEQREFHRAQIDRSIVFVGLNNEGQVEIQGIGRAIDLSPSGMMFESTEPIYIKMLSIRAATEKGNSVKISGQVIYSMPNSPGAYRTGVQFTAPPAERARFVAEMMKQ